MPRLRDFDMPRFSCEMTFSRGSWQAARSAVASLEPSLMTVTCRSPIVCASADLTVSAMKSWALKAGMTMLTRGMDGALSGRLDVRGRR